MWWTCLFLGWSLGFGPTGLMFGSLEFRDWNMTYVPVMCEVFFFSHRSSQTHYIYGANLLQFFTEIPQTFTEPTDVHQVLDKQSQLRMKVFLHAVYLSAHAFLCFKSLIWIIVWHTYTMCKYGCLFMCLKHDVGSAQVVLNVWKSWWLNKPIRLELFGLTVSKRTSLSVSSYIHECWG